MAEVFSTKVLQNIADLHGKVDAAKADLKALLDHLFRHLPVSFPAPPKDESLPIVQALERRVSNLEGKIDAIGLELEQVSASLKQLVGV